MKTTLSAILAATLLAALPSVGSADDHHDRDGDRFSFALLGDGPYGAAAEPLWDNMIRDVNASHVAFVMHTGDAKAGSEQCTDELLARRFAQFQQFRAPFVFTPGDNDWTDCHRPNNGGWYPLDRLAFVRGLFFPDPHHTTGGERMEVETQADDPGFAPYVENVMFERDGVVFGAVHVVGSNNDLDPWTGFDPADSAGSPRADRMAEYLGREAASLAWIDRVFDRAEAEGAPAVALLMQADPNIGVSANPAWDDAGFTAFLDRLYARAKAFGKPVLLAHGDSHEFFVDAPFGMAPYPANVVPHFLRVQGFGSKKNHWVKVNVDPNSRAVFSFEQMIVPENVAK